MRIEIKLVRPDAKYPRCSTDGAAGYDLYAAEQCSLEPGSTKVVPLGIQSSFSRDFVALIWDRSGMGYRGIHRFAGVVDSDYRGEWGVVLHNSTDTALHISPGDRIAQVLFQRVEHPQMVLSAELGESQRGEGGFGSTGT